MSEIFFRAADARVDVIAPGSVTRKVLARGGKLMLVEVSFEEGGVGAVHSHPHDQATYCLEGEFAFTVGPESFTLTPGDSLSIPSGVAHGTVARRKGKLLDVFSPQREDFL
jgi:quercetin dioxygenase-like cupin family protein